MPEESVIVTVQAVGDPVAASTTRPRRVPELVSAPRQVGVRLARSSTREAVKMQKHAFIFLNHLSFRGHRLITPSEPHVASVAPSGENTRPG